MRAIRRPDLRIQVVQVVAHGHVRAAQLLGDELVGHTLSGQLGHLQLARCDELARRAGFCHSPTRSSVLSAVPISILVMTRLLR